MKDPLGRISTRKYLLAAIALLVAVLTCLSFSTTARAADASWQDNSTIQYDNREFRGPVTVDKDNNPPNTKKGGVYYIAPDSANSSQQKAYVIYFAPGNSPGSATSAEYVTYDYGGPNNLTNPSDSSTISVDNASYTASPSAGTTSCAIEGMGWIICPVTTFLAKGMDYIYSLVDGFLEVRPLATTQDQALYRAWSVMRNIANVAFVIAFLIIVYSQISNIGISNYSVKRMLPRLVIAAILVNASYWICALAVDIFNILGYGIQDLFISIRNSLVGSEGNSWDVISWESVSSFILSGGSIAAAAGIGGYLAVTAITSAAVGGGFIFLFLPILLSVLFVVLMTFLILAARQAIITILIIIAPLAFVAFLLPNTEKWFDRWRSTLFTLLLVFPGFSFIFGGAQLASAVIIQNATSFNIVILGMAVQVAPLFITPLLLKLGGGVLNRFAGVVNNPTKGVFDRGKNWARERSEQSRQAGLARLSRGRQRAIEQGFTGHIDSKGRRRRRFNPYNLTLDREYNRREREGMKAANESMVAGRFERTAAGRRIYNRSQDASSEKRVGESVNQRAYYRPLADTTHADYGSSQNQYRRALHHQAHIASGQAKAYEDQITAHSERDLQQSFLASNGLRKVRLNTEADTQAAKRAEEQWNTIIANIQATGSGAPNLRGGEARLADAIRKTTEQITVEGYAKSQAEALRQETLTKTLLENTRIIEGKTIREYAGGIRGKEGADTVLATAVAQDRKQWGEKSGEKLELIKHFNLSSENRQLLAMGQDVRVEKDGVPYTFEATDQYARDAAIDEQLSTGSFSQIKAIIDAAVELDENGQTGATYNWRTTVASAIAKKGLDNKAFFWGAKSIDDVSQGLYTEAQAIKEHLLGDKVKAEKLAVQDVYSLKMAFEAASNPDVTGLLAPHERAKFDANYEAMRQSADLILRTPELSKSLNHEAREILERYRA